MKLLQNTSKFDAPQFFTKNYMILKALLYVIFFVALVAVLLLHKLIIAFVRYHLFSKHEHTDLPFFGAMFRFVTMKPGGCFLVVVVVGEKTR